MRKAFTLLINFSKTETRNFKRLAIGNILKDIKEMLEILYFENDVYYLFSPYGLEFGMNCLKNSTILEKQLLGMKSITTSLEVVGKCFPEQAEILLTQEPNFLQIIFSKN